MFAEMYGKMSRKPKGGRARGGPRGTGRPVQLHSQTGHSMKHGGNTGHWAGVHTGPHAGAPHRGHHTGMMVAGHMQNGGGFQSGAHSASPFSGKMHRATGYKGPHDYAAAGPQQGFMIAGKGHYMGRGPSGY